MINIAIIGPVGVGKSTVIDKLKEIKELERKTNFEINYIKEKDKYAFLENEYSDRKNWAFITQVDFLMLRCRTLFLENDKQKKDEDIINIFERLYLDDYLYFFYNVKKGKINNEQKKVYEFLFKEVLEKLNMQNIKIDLIIVLECDEKCLIERRDERGRFIENKLEEEFKEIEEIYNQHNFFTTILDNHFIQNKPKIVYIENESEITKTANEIINEIVKILPEDKRNVYEEKVISNYKQ